MEHDNNLKGMGNSAMPEMFITDNERIKAEISSMIDIIADKNCIPALICLLDDKEVEVRWVAAQGLIKIGRCSIDPLLRAIKDGKSSCQPDKGAYQVLQTLLTSNEKKALHRLLVFPENKGLRLSETSAELTSIIRCRN